MRNWENKWTRAAIPALLIHCCIGMVYCWSLFKGEIAQYIGRTNGEVEWAFSLAIFFLGASAMLAGNMVERDIKKASLLSAIFYTLGLAGTGLAIYMKSLLLLYLFYGVIMGIGLGIGYLTPVKTLMLWFSKNKGLGTGIAVAGFGLSKVIASPVMVFLMEHVGLYQMFLILAASSFVFMYLGHVLIRKPSDWVEQKGKSTLDVKALLKNPVFIGIWLVFYLNISCGLGIISQEKDILNAMGLSLGAIALISSVSAVFNVAGRLVFSSISDKLKMRSVIYRIILWLSILVCGIVAFTDAITNAIIPLVLLLNFVINAANGGGFSCLPPVLADAFGMKDVSKIHGLTLSAWAIAGLTGNQISAFIVSATGSYNDVIYVTTALFVVALLISRSFIKPIKKVAA